MPFCGNDPIYNMIICNTLAWGWGDPHITTLDGRTYTFNGWGEYIMLQHLSSSSQDSFTLQGRMVPFNMTSATQYSAFAFGNHHYTIEVKSILCMLCFIFIAVE